MEKKLKQKNLTRSILLFLFFFSYFFIGRIYSVSAAQAVSGYYLGKITSSTNSAINKKKKDKPSKFIGIKTVVRKKEFQQAPSVSPSYVLKQHAGINAYSRSGNNELSGGYNFFEMDGYTVGGGNTPGIGVSGIEFTIDGIPINNDADGGEIYDLGLMNSDIQSVQIQRGVTDANNLGNWDVGGHINITTLYPTKHSYFGTIDGVGSYGLNEETLYANSGISKNGDGVYVSVTNMGISGFRDYTNLSQQQYYINATKRFVGGGKLSLILMGNKKSYDRGSAISVEDLNLYGPKYNGLPNGENTAYPSGQYLETSPFYKQWNYSRFLGIIQYKDQLFPNIKFLNNLYYFDQPTGQVLVPATGSGTNITAAYPMTSSDFLYDYEQAHNIEYGEMPTLYFKLPANNRLETGARISQFTSHFYTLPPDSNNITGGSSNAFYIQKSYGVFVQDKYKPVHNLIIKAGVRFQAVAQQYMDLLSPASPEYNTGHGGPNEGNSIYVTLPSGGAEYLLTKNLNIFAGAGESFTPPAIFAYKGNTSIPPASMNISPEKVYDYQGGIRYADKKMMLSLQGFSDRLVNEFNSIGVLEGGSMISEPSTAGSTTMKGLLASAKFRLGYGFSADGNYSDTVAVFNNYIQGLGGAPSSQVNVTGFEEPFVPQIMYNIGLNYKKYNLTGRISDRYTGSQSMLDYSNADQFTVPSFNIVNLHLAYNVKPSLLGIKNNLYFKNIQLFLNVYNLFNKTYYNPAFLTAGYNNAETPFVYPGEPINFFAGANVKF
jgi:iron complex outermembrane receptor protein